MQSETKNNNTLDNDYDCLHDYDHEPVSFDETVRGALAFCDSLPKTEPFEQQRRLLAELQSRLSGGRLHLAVLGQFNRGKSSFINALLGIKALPASVLPLTSVPTVVEYGTTQSCKIKFLDPRDDLVVTGNDIEIANTLRQYVAEENNPHNTHRVRAASITCDSDLLANGTVIIDTPGFGSTYLHNTETTMNLLAECDAAIFLLSADPPMTQTEMEFLRDVKGRVPKLFFVLNKSDLLTKQGLGEVDRFIQTVLQRELGFLPDTKLYHVSAAAGERAKTSDVSDPHWVASGLEAIKKEVLDFMIREKYFTLSDALQGKYDEAINEIGALIKKNHNDLMAPIAHLRDEIAEVTNAIQSISLELNAELKSCAEEKEALDAEIGMWAVKNREAYSQSMNTAISILLNGKHPPNEAAGIAASMLPKHAADLGAQFFAAARSLTNKSIRKIAFRHAEAFSKLRERYAELLGESARNFADISAPVEQFIEQFEIANESAKISELIRWDMPESHLTDIFRKTSARLEAVREFYEPLCAQAVTENIAAAERSSQAAAAAAWEKMQESIRISYRELIDRLNALYKVKEGYLAEADEAVRADITFWRERAREFKKVFRNG